MRYMVELFRATTEYATVAIDADNRTEAFTIAYNICGSARNGGIELVWQPDEKHLPTIGLEEIHDLSEYQK